MTHNNDLLFLAGNREWAGLVGLGAEHRGDRTYGAGPDGPPARTGRQHQGLTHLICGQHGHRHDAHCPAHA
jgi:hypothetical protein